MPERHTPEYLTYTHGPNLILCDRDELTRVVLSLYAVTPNQPAPTNDELIYCTPQTTAEEMENFLRLAYASREGRRVYTAVNMQDLSYEAVSAVERLIKRQLDDRTTNKCALVFICTSEQPCLIASLYSRQRVQPVLLDVNVLRDYLSIIIDPNSLRVVTSKRSGNGKSKYIHQLRSIQWPEHTCRTIRVKQSTLDLNAEVEKLFAARAGRQKLCLFHIDITSEALFNVDAYLLSLVFTGYLKHTVSGRVWRRRVHDDVYLIEITNANEMIEYLPRLTLASPQEHLYNLRNQTPTESMFTAECRKEKYQRVCYYLHRMFNTTDTVNIPPRSAGQPEQLSELDCLDVLLSENTGLVRPSWRELRNYVQFANLQLKSMESWPLRDSSPNVWSFFVRLSLVMASDFGMSSLSLPETDQTVANLSLDRFRIRDDRRWETFLRPYVVLNADGKSVNMLGVYLSRSSTTKKFMNPNTGAELSEAVSRTMPSFAHLAQPLLTLKLPVFTNFNARDIVEKINILCQIFGNFYTFLSVSKSISF